MNICNKEFLGGSQTLKKVNKQQALKNVANNYLILSFDYFFILFYLYIYHPDLQESDGGVNA